MRIGSILNVADSNSMSQYRISSIHGNPISLQPIKRLQNDNSAKGNKALVIANRESVSPYVKEYNDLPKTTQTTVNGFAQFFSMNNHTEEQNDVDESFQSFLQDTLGMMGSNNCIKDKLLQTVALAE